MELYVFVKRLFLCYIIGQECVLLIFFLLNSFRNLYLKKKKKGFISWLTTIVDSWYSIIKYYLMVFDNNYVSYVTAFSLVSPSFFDLLINSYKYIIKPIH